MQGHHQANALGVALEALEVGQHALAQRGIPLVCRHGAGEKLIERTLEPFADGELAEVAERWIADVVHQAGHFHQAFQRAFEAVQAMVAGAVAQLLVQRANDETTGLLHLQRMGQATAHRRVALQREYLGLLLQPAHGGRMHDAPPVAFQLVDHRLQVAIGCAHARLRTTIRPLAGYLVLEVHRPGHGFALVDEENRSLTRAGGITKIAPLRVA